jgi:hypothetical protein
MAEPIRTWEEFSARSDTLEQVLEGELDLATGEHALGEVKAQLTYLRACQQVLVARRRELSLADYREWRRRLRTMLHHTKQAHYHLLWVQEANLHLAVEDSKR